MLFYFIFAMDCNFYSLFYQIRSFSVPWKKEYKENRRKKKEKKTHRIWIDFKPIYRPWLVARMKFCSVLHGSRQCYKFFRNFVLRLHVKSFIPARRNPFFVLPESRFAGTEFHFASTHTQIIFLYYPLSTNFGTRYITGQ